MSDGEPGVKEYVEKLVEEVKLYWTVQVAVGAVLGFLGSNLRFVKLASDPVDPVRNITICVIASLILTIGSVYNLIGNYYTCMAGVRARLHGDQENIVTPTLAAMYLILQGLVGSLVALSLTRYQADGTRPVPVSACMVGVVLFSFLNWLICRRVYKGLFAHTDEQGVYRKYSASLARLFLVRASADQPPGPLAPKPAPPL